LEVGLGFFKLEGDEAILKLRVQIMKFVDFIS